MVRARVVEGEVREVGRAGPCGPLWAVVRRQEGDCQVRCWVGLDWAWVSGPCSSPAPGPRGCLHLWLPQDWRGPCPPPSTRPTAGRCQEVSVDLSQPGAWVVFFLLPLWVPCSAWAPTALRVASTLQTLPLCTVRGGPCRWMEGGGLCCPLPHPFLFFVQLSLLFFSHCCFLA